MVMGGGVENVGENKTPQVMGCIKGQGVADSTSLPSRTSLKPDVSSSHLSAGKGSCASTQRPGAEFAPFSLSIAQSYDSLPTGINSDACGFNGIVWEAPAGEEEARHRRRCGTTKEQTTCILTWVDYALLDVSSNIHLLTWVDSALLVKKYSGTY